MITAIIASILSLFMIFGGIIPNYSNKILEDSLKSSLNTEKVVVKVTANPSYGMIGGNFDRVEISAKNIKLSNLEFDSFRLVSEKVKLDYDKMYTAKGFEYIKEGSSDVELILSAETISKMINLNSLTTKLNNILANFRLPIPMAPSSVSVDNLSLTFQNNRPALSGNLIALGGFFTAPFSISADLLVTAKNTIEIYEPQITVMDQPLVIDQIQDMVKYVNPIFDVKTLNDKDLKISLKNLYFKNNKLKILANLAIK